MSLDPHYFGGAFMCFARKEWTAQSPAFRLVAVPYPLTDIIPACTTKHRRGRPAIWELEARHMHRRAG